LRLLAWLAKARDTSIHDTAFAQIAISQDARIRTPAEVPARLARQAAGAGRVRCASGWLRPPPM